MHNSIGIAKSETRSSHPVCFLDALSQSGLTNMTGTVLQIVYSVLLQMAWLPSRIPVARLVILALRLP